MAFVVSLAYLEEPIRRTSIRQSTISNDFPDCGQISYVASRGRVNEKTFKQS